MQISDFDFELPQALIATHPPAERRASRLLHLSGDSIADRQFAELPSLLGAGDLLVFNDTRVIKARLRGRKESGGKIEVLVERVLAESHAIAHIKASKAPKPGTRLIFGNTVSALVTERQGEFFRLDFDTPVAPFLASNGEVPLPPYLGREAESADDERYQTVYATSDGAVAAPTAGLHFDQDMLDETLERGAAHAFVTLHVGAGTFQSLREEQVADNRLHAERLIVSEVVCRRVAETKQQGGRVIAVGTTSVRALESAAASGELRPVDGETDLFITPGFDFRVVDAMLTNFHLPQSSLLMLVGAFAGVESIMSAYRHAVSEKYRFFSYGDAMFIEPAQQ